MEPRLIIEVPPCISEQDQVNFEVRLDETEWVEVDKKEVKVEEEVVSEKKSSSSLDQAV